MKNKRLKILFITALLVIAVWYLKHNFLLVINKTESLPQRVFLVSLEKVPTQKDQTFVGYVPGNHYYSKDRLFIKMLGGLPGDKIKIKGRDFYINDKFIGTAKTHSLKGNPLEMSEPGIIPKGKYFAYTPHKDSYDSRYKEIGLIDEKNIIGVVIASF